MQCGGCTECCIHIDVPWMGSPAGEACRECAVGVGCKIWETVPVRCKKYACAYRQNNVVLDILRPDRCGVIFEKLADDLVFGLITRDRDEVPHEAWVQVEQFMKEGYSVVMDYVKDRKMIAFPARGRAKADVEKQFFAIQERNLGGSSVQH